MNNEDMSPEKFKQTLRDLTERFSQQSVNNRLKMLCLFIQDAGIRARANYPTAHSQIELEAVRLEFWNEIQHGYQTCLSIARGSREEPVHLDWLFGRHERLGQSRRSQIELIHDCFEKCEG